MSELMDQYRCPTGRRGMSVAKLMNSEHEKLTLWGLSKAKLSLDDVILDVGCGGGKTINRLAKIASQGRVYGIDCSPDMVKYSRKVNKKLIVQDRVEIVAGSVMQMSFRDDFFDLVTAIETYYFWSSFPEALKEIMRVLKPSGRLLFVNEMVQDGMYEVTHSKLIKETHVRLIPLQEIRNVMRNLGFADIEAFTKDESPWNAIIAQKK